MMPRLPIFGEVTEIVKIAKAAEIAGNVEVT